MTNKHLSLPILWPLLLVILTACAPAPTAPDPTTTPSPTTAPPTEQSLSSDSDDIIETELGEAAALTSGQTLSIPAENLSVFYEVDIEWECEEGLDCEVPLIYFAYFHVTKDGEFVGTFDWEPTLEIGDYTIISEERHKNYDYEAHRWLMEITITKN